MSISNCPKCGREISDDSNICPGCGTFFIKGSSQKVADRGNQSIIIITSDSPIAVFKEPKYYSSVIGHLRGNDQISIKDQQKGYFLIIPVVTADRSFSSGWIKKIDIEEYIGGLESLGEGKKNNSTTIWVIGILFALTILLCFLSPENPSQPESNPSTQKSSSTVLNENQKMAIEKVINDYVSVGIIQKVDIEGHKIWVDPDSWSIMNVDKKEYLSRKFGLYCSFKSRYTDESAEIYDYLSGKKLAKIGPFGFKVY